MHAVWSSDRFEREAMAYSFDEGLGHAVDVMQQRADGAWNRTLLIYLNDNGGLLVNGCPNDPLRGGKISMLEGGIHVRAVLGGGWLPPELRGSYSRTVLSFADFYPTLSYLAGALMDDARLHVCPSPMDAYACACTRAYCLVCGASHGA